MSIASYEWNFLFQVPSDCKQGIDENYSEKTLPEGLVIKQSKIPNAGLGVFATQLFPSRTRFGPYLGKIEKYEEDAHESGYSWQVSYLLSGVFFWSSLYWGCFTAK